MEDPYETLGLTTDAGEAEIRRRYLELVREFPPDRAPERFTAIHAAYEAMRDPARGCRPSCSRRETKTDSLEAIGGRPASRGFAGSGCRSPPCSSWRNHHERPADWRTSRKSSTGSADGWGRPGPRPRALDPDGPHAVHGPASTTAATGPSSA